MDEMRQFKCTSGHILGLVTWNGHGIRRLMLYRYALDPQAERLPEPDVLGVVESAMEVRCSICEGIRAWVPGEAEIEEIISRYKRRQAATEAIIIKEPIEI